MTDIQNKITDTIYKIDVKINVHVIMTYIIKTILFGDVRYSKEVREYIQDYVSEFILFIISKDERRLVLI